MCIKFLDFFNLWIQGIINHAVGRPKAIVGVSWLSVSLCFAIPISKPNPHYPPSLYLSLCICLCICLFALCLCCMPQQSCMCPPTAAFGQTALQVSHVASQPRHNSCPLHSNNNCTNNSDNNNNFNCGAIKGLNAASYHNSCFKSCTRPTKKLSALAPKLIRKLCALCSDRAHAQWESERKQREREKGESESVFGESAGERACALISLRYVSLTLHAQQNKAQIEQQITIASY